MAYTERLRQKAVRYVQVCTQQQKLRKIGEIAVFANDYIQELKEVEGCPAKITISPIFAISPKIAKTWRNRSFCQKLFKTNVRGGIRVPIKNCDFSKNCKKLKKSQFLLKLLNSRVKGGRRVPSKNCDFSKNCEKLEKSKFLLKLLNL